VQAFDPVGLHENQPPRHHGCHSIGLPTCICDAWWYGLPPREYKAADCVGKFPTRTVSISRRRSDWQL